MGFDSTSPYFPNVQTSRTDQRLMNMRLTTSLTVESLAGVCEAHPGTVYPACDGELPAFQGRSRRMRSSTYLQLHSKSEASLRSTDTQEQTMN